MRRKILLVCGILSPLMYALADALAGTLSGSYSFRDQTISELGAIGAASRTLFSALLIPTYLLLAAFGVGVWQSAEGRRGVRIVGGILIGLGVLALTVGQFVPMRQRGTEQGLSGTLHLVEGIAAMLFLFTAMGFAAAAFGKRFRIYTIITIALILAFGVWTSTHAARLEAGSATPWLGVIERIWWYAYQLWFVVLGITLLRQHADECGPHSGSLRHPTPHRVAQ